MGLVFLLGISSMSAQVVLPDRVRGKSLNENVFGLGFAIGPASGVGLSFRHHLPSPMSYEITGGIIKVDERLSYSVGVEVQYDLVRGAISRFFVTSGASYFYTGSSSHNEMDGPGRLGVGIGGEFATGPGLHVTTELMFTYFTDGTVLPLPQVGLYYYFY
jgi:hypothetical protein